jgi:hypothetical protein
MKIKVGKNYKRNVIILSVVALLFAVSGGFLLWRINQRDTLAPEDSDAATNCGVAPKYSFNKPPTTNIGPFPENGKVVLFYKSFSGSGYRPKLIFKDKNAKSYTYKMPTLDSSRRARVVTDIVVAKGDYIQLVSSNDDVNQGNPECAPVKGPPYMSFGWIAPNSNKTCGSGLAGPPTQYIPFAKPSVSSDMTWAESFGNEIVGKGRQCWADWREWPGDYDFNDYFLQISYVADENFCDGGSWTVRPTSTYDYCADIRYTFVAEDSDGVDVNSIEVKLNGNNRLGFSKDEVGNKVTVSEVLSSSTTCLSAGTYTLTATWKDKKGVTGDKCNITTTFTVLEAPPPPLENVCDGGSWITQPTGNYEYCSEVKYSFVAEDTDGIDADTIVVNLNNIARTNFEEEEIGNKITVSEILGTSTNCLEPGNYTLAATWKDKLGVTGVKCNLSSSFTVLGPNVEPPVTPPPVVVDLPETGIFDEGAESSMVLGAILLFLGFTWLWIGQRVYLLVNFIGGISKKVSSSVKNISKEMKKRRKNTLRRRKLMEINRRKERFEKKVVKKW